MAHANQENNTMCRRQCGNLKPKQHSWAADVLMQEIRDKSVDVMKNHVKADQDGDFHMSVDMNRAQEVAGKQNCSNMDAKVVKNYSFYNSN